MITFSHPLVSVFISHVISLFKISHASVVPSNSHSLKTSWLLRNASYPIPILFNISINLNNSIPFPSIHLHSTLSHPFHSHPFTYLVPYYLNSIPTLFPIFIIPYIHLLAYHFPTTFSHSIPTYSFTYLDSH